MLRTTTVLIFAFLYFRWTEGLISAAKAVGLGAKLLVDAADKVVLGSGKFEEIMAASQVRAVFFMRNISLTDLFPHSVRLSVLYHIFFFSSTYIQIWYLNIYLLAGDIGKHRPARDCQQGQGQGGQLQL